MNCLRYKEIENKNLFKRLTSKEQKELNEHISVCSSCRSQYELYKLCQNEFDLITDISEPMFLTEKVNERLDKEFYDIKPSVFDFIFGYGHNPVKAGLAVGLGLLVFVVLAVNVISLNKKPAEYDNYYAYNSNSIYLNQFYIK